MPQVTARDLIRFLKARGFVEDRQSGSHLTLWNYVLVEGLHRLEACKALGEETIEAHLVQARRT